jgi:hypothetical protein
MAKDTARTQKRHVRDKATIDHLVHGFTKLKPPPDKRPKRSPTTPAGLPVEEQIRKEWDPKKGGGLPIFQRPSSVSDLSPSRRRM